MSEDFAMRFPVRSLLLKDGSSVMLLRHGNSLWLPIFTDADSLATYIERSEIRDYREIALATAKDLAAFLEKPPGRTPKYDAVIADPISPEPGTVSLFNPINLISSLRQ
jgi:hypothetical protein